MKKKIINTIYVFIILNLVFCKPKNRCDYVKEIGLYSEKKIEFIRLEKIIPQLKNKAETQIFLDQYHTFSNVFLRRKDYPHDSIVVNSIFKLAHDPNLDTLNNDVEKTFANLDFLESELNQAFGRIKSEFPDFKAPQIYTLVSGFGTDLYVSDSLIVIGLDYFLGDSSSYRPDIPDYLFKRFRKEYIASSIILLLSDKYNKSELLDNSLLAEMLHYGKAYYFTEKMMPCTHDSLIIGYSSKQLLDTEFHKKIVWEYFVKNKLFFETNHFTVNKFIGERPYTGEIGNKCPGRIGRWLGWQIVKAYSNQKSVTLPEMMKNTDAKKIFNESAYRP